MKRIIYSFLFTILLLSCNKESTNINDLVETTPHVLKANFIAVNNSVRGFYSALPAHYEQTEKTYPLLVFLHGGGQTGNGDADLGKVLGEAVPELLKEKLFPPNFNVNGKNYSFIVLAPQFNELPKNPEILSFIEYAKQHYRVDATRIYLSGLSAGGVATSNFGAEYPSLLAAIVPMSGVSLWFDLEIKAKSIADGKLPVWAFHNSKDQSISITEVTQFLKLINDNRPAIPPKLTQFLAFGLLNHDSWTRATDPTYHEDGMNIYEWMLQYSR
jgi:predicted peptidase